MPRKAEGLTAAKVRTAKPGRYGDGAGLYLLVRAAAAPKPGTERINPKFRFWLFRYSKGGRLREMGLGPESGPSPVSLADARAKPAACWKRSGEGGIPGRTRRRQGSGRGCRSGGANSRHNLSAGREWLHRGARSLLAKRQTPSAVGQHARHLCHPVLGDLPAANVDTRAVMSVLEPIWRTQPETASRLRRRIEAVLDYAKARGWRTAENPARWRGHVENMLPKRSQVQAVQHHAALVWGEIGAFMAALANQEGSARSRCDSRS
jgi:hypothetical protein